MVHSAYNPKNIVHTLIVEFTIQKFTVIQNFMDCSLFEMEIEYVHIMSNLMDTVDLKILNYTALALSYNLIKIQSLVNVLI